MVYRTRRTYRRKKYGRKKMYRRRYRRTYRYNKRGQKLYLFKRFCNYGELYLSSVNPIYGAFNFSLSDLPNASEFTSLYDMYKINCVKITFYPQQTVSNSINTAYNANASSRFFTVIDYNDSNSPTSLDELRQYQSCKITPVLRQHKRVIYKPKILDTNGFSISPWMSTATPNANYLGLKYAAEPTDATLGASMIYTVEAKLYMSFRNVK